MLTWNNALYIVTSSDDDDLWMRVLKIPGGPGVPAPPVPYGPNDIQEVLRLGGGEYLQHLRGIAVHDNMLCVGTMSNQIWCSANPVQQPTSAPSIDPLDQSYYLNTSAFNATEGWQQVAFPAELGTVINYENSGIWHLLSFNNYLYATITDRLNGFEVWKGCQEGRPGCTMPAEALRNAAGWAWLPIVSNKKAADGVSLLGKYPSGLGNERNVAVGLFVFNGYVYAGTYTDPLEVIAFAESVQDIISQWNPAQIYRFGSDDTWQMVIGDVNDRFPTKLGNYGAGFFNRGLAQRLMPAPYNTANFSMNNYIWWMAVYNGKLYVTTYDIRILLEYRDVMYDIFGISDNPGLQAQVESLMGMINTANTNPPGFDVYYTADGRTWTPLTTNGFGDKFNWGGRVMKATGSGLFFGTANPFWGGQVWKMQTTTGGGTRPIRGR